MNFNKNKFEQINPTRIAGNKVFESNHFEMTRNLVGRNAIPNSQTPPTVTNIPTQNPETIFNLRRQTSGFLKNPFRK